MGGGWQALLKLRFYRVNDFKIGKILTFVLVSPPDSALKVSEYRTPQNPRFFLVIQQKFIIWTTEIHSQTLARSCHG